MIVSLPTLTLFPKTNIGLLSSLLLGLWVFFSQTSLTIPVMTGTWAALQHLIIRQRNRYAVWSRVFFQRLLRRKRIIILFFRALFFNHPFIRLGSWFCCTNTLPRTTPLLFYSFIFIFKVIEYSSCHVFFIYFLTSFILVSFWRHDNIYIRTEESVDLQE